MKHFVSIFYYCIAFPRKIKEIFSAEHYFFAKIFGPVEGQGHQMQKKGHRIHPKIPQGTQQRGQQAKKQHRPSQGAQHHIPPQQAVRPAEGEEKQPGAHGQAVQGVPQGGGAGQPQPERAQQVVQQSRRQTQQHRLAEQGQLPGDLDLHGPYPNSRRRKPPCSRPPSS